MTIHIPEWMVWLSVAGAGALVVVMVGFAVLGFLFWLAFRKV
ncbi:hypothetical protein [Paraburkholderia sp. BL21I4N1]|nr:hypothetical protein [Paraburkholderia sp. BL21I4N1]PQV50996.1 hypothetical protein B0G83_105359 [Paraburkholderia sp. BL21I4N1]